MKPDIAIVYSILRSWALKGEPRTYSDLSREYEVKTGEWHEPHGSWDIPLGELNTRLASAGAPALSALVILKTANEPGAGFWGCASNAPARPTSELARLEVWQDVVHQIREYQWPASLPS